MSARDRARRLLAGVDQVFGERTDDAVATSIDLADAVAMATRSLDDCASRDVDDGGHAAGLGVEGVSFGMESDGG